MGLSIVLVATYIIRTRSSVETKVTLSFPQNLFGANAHLLSALFYNDVSCDLTLLCRRCLSYNISLLRFITVKEIGGVRPCGVMMPYFKALRVACCWHTSSEDMKVDRNPSSCWEKCARLLMSHLASIIAFALCCWSTYPWCWEPKRRLTD